MRWNAAAVCSTRCAPASVRLTPRVVRRTSGSPTAFSSSAMRWLTEALLSCRRRAAAVKLPVSARMPRQWMCDHRSSNRLARSMRIPLCRIPNTDSSVSVSTAATRSATLRAGPAIPQLQEHSMNASIVGHYIGGQTVPGKAPASRSTTPPPAPSPATSPWPRRTRWPAPSPAPRPPSPPGRTRRRSAAPASCSSSWSC